MSLRVLIAGDYCPRARVAKSIEEGDYSSVLSSVKDIIGQFDYSFVNLECAVASDNDNKLIKCGPNLKTTEKGVDALRWAGFDCVTLANNHALDYGEMGLLRTIDKCHSVGINTVGAGCNLLEAEKTLYLSSNGEKLAVINCCEREFSIATKNKAGCNPLNIVKQYYSIKEAKKQADYVLVIIHGGNEYYPLPSPRMQQAYRFFIDAGADAIINHHQHCYSGYEVYHEKPIFYGLGNFCFDEPGKLESWYKGFMVSLCFGENVTFNILPYRQCVELPSVSFLCEEEESRFYQDITRINEVIIDEEQLNIEYDLFLASSNNLMKEVFSPFLGRIMRSISSSILSPFLFRKRKKLELLAYIQCESHYPKVINFLEKI